jgi:hypothetical protein
MGDERREGGLEPFEPEEAWRALVLRMMPSRPARVTPQPPEMEVFPGQLPPNLPVDIPLPAGSRIVGTVLNSGGLEEVTVYIDALESPRDLLDFYRERLLPGGWYRVDTGGHASNGFNDADGSYQIQGQFCRSEQGPTLLVTATQQENGLAVLRVGLYTDERTSPCLPHQRRGPPANPVPPLPLPAGARIVMGAGPWGSRGPDSAHSGAEIEIELDLAAVAEHYSRHLEAGGWTKRDSDQSGLCAWSTWTFQHEREEAWRGLLVVFQRPDCAHRYVLQTWAEWLREA